MKVNSVFKINLIFFSRRQDRKHDSSCLRMVCKVFFEHPYFLIRIRPITFSLSKTPRAKSHHVPHENLFPSHFFGLLSLVSNYIIHNPPAYYNSKKYQKSFSFFDMLSRNNKRIQNPKSTRNFILCRQK